MLKICNEKALENRKAHYQCNFDNCEKKAFLYFSKKYKKTANEGYL